MNRTTILAAATLSGAALLTGAGIAGASDDGPRSTPTSPAVVEDQLSTTEQMGLELDAAESTASPDEQQVDTQQDDDQDDAAAEAQLDEDAEVDRDADETPEEAEETHGERISGIARDTEPGPDHGATVSEAARDNHGHADDDA